MTDTNINDRRLSTADMASAGRATSEEPPADENEAGEMQPKQPIGDAETPVAGERPRVAEPPRVAQQEDDAPAPLMAEVEATGFRSRWQDVQVDFVDDPKVAVERADALVAEVMRQLAREFASERESLEKQWSGGGQASTEDLRLALQRYRSFFSRLLTV
jgi:hypothetical protein